MAFSDKYSYYCISAGSAILLFDQLLKDDNTGEVNCEADFHFQAFHQKLWLLWHVPRLPLLGTAEVEYFSAFRSLYRLCLLAGP